MQPIYTGMGIIDLLTTEADFTKLKIELIWHISDYRKLDYSNNNVYVNNVSNVYIYLLYPQCSVSLK